MLADQAARPLARAENQAIKDKDQEEPERDTSPDNSKEGGTDPEPESPDIDGSWDTRISFDVLSNLTEASKADSAPFQTLQIRGEVMIQVWTPCILPSYFSYNQIENL